ncbi:MAG: M6 family metalloprotease domain-containing protein [Bacteroidota bacterium]
MKKNRLLITGVALALAMFTSLSGFAQQTLNLPHNHYLSVGVPASPDAAVVSQPSGQTLTLYLKGDGRIHWAQTTDGYTVLPNSSGYYEYGIIDVNLDLILSGVIAHDPAQREAAEISFLSGISTGNWFSKNQIRDKKEKYQFDPNDATPSQEKIAGFNKGAFPTRGVRKNLVILVQYSGTSFTSGSNAVFNNLFNQVGYNAGKGSFRDYFLENSYQQLTINSDVVGPYTLSKTSAYYGQDDPTSGNDKYSRELVAEAVALADAAGVDFSQYDNDRDGYVDGITIIHAGRGEEVSGVANDTWSHSWTFGPVSYDGVVLNAYTCSPELMALATLNTIGVFVHEFSHNLGICDFYDIDYGNSGGTAYATDNWDVMGGGSYNSTPSGSRPAHHNAFSKYYYDWTQPFVINTAGIYKLANAESSAVSYLYTTPTANEYFMLENRQKRLSDTDIPGSGMLIYHIQQDSIRIRWNAGINLAPAKQYGNIEEADGNETMNAAGRAGDPFPGSTSKTSFTDATTPNSRSWAGANTNKPITAISSAGTPAVITFTFMGGAATLAPTANFYSNDTMVVAGGSINFYDCSSNVPTSWAWTFAGGTPATSATQNQTVTYNTPGLYQVQLTATNANGSNLITRTQYVHVVAAALPVVNFVADRTNILIGDSVQYTDVSTNTPTSWYWEFEGGTPATSTAQNPKVFYYTGGLYKVKLTCTNDVNGSATLTKQRYIKVGAKSAWIEQNTRLATYSRGISGIKIVDPTNAWAWAYDGYYGANTIDYIRTTDGGTTWNPSVINNVPATITDFALGCMYPLTSTTCWATLYYTGGTAGEHGGVWKTTDGGTTWARQASATIFKQTTSFPNTVHFWDANNGWCMGDPYDPAGNPVAYFFEMYTTTNGGTTWTAVPTAAGLQASGATAYGTVNNYEVVGNTIWFGATDGRVYKSTDRGLTWSYTATGMPHADRVVMKDANNGICWCAERTAAPTNVFQVRKTTDGGATWVVYTYGAGMQLGDVDFVSGTTDTWVTTDADYASNLSMGSSFSLNNMSACTWTRIDTAIQYTAVAFLNDTIGYAGGFTESPQVGGIYKWKGKPGAKAYVYPSAICSGNSTQLRVVTKGGTYAWSSNPAGFTSTIANPIVSPTITTTYTVTVTSAFNQSTSSVVVTVVSGVPAQPSVITGTSTPCEASSQTYSVTNVAGVTYTWAFPAGWTITSGQGTNSVTVTVGAGAGNIQVTPSNVCGNGTIRTLSATPVAAQPVSVSVAATATTICSGVSVTFTATATNGGTTPTYQWQLNGSNVGTGASTYTNGTLANGNQIVCIVTSNAACPTGNPATSNTVTMTVNPNPTVTVNSPSICAGSTATLTANGATSYSWTGGLTGNPATATPALSTTYTVTGTSLGCTGTATSVVTVNTVPTVTVNSPTICAGSTATLTAAGGTTYSWNTGATTNPINVSPGTTTTYTVSGTTSGCTGTTTSVVTVNANPTVTVNSPSICAGATATLTAAGATTYNWSTGASTNPITVTPGANTTYTVTGTTSGCTGTTTSVVTVNAIPTVTVNSPAICAGTTATLTAAGATTYNWSTGASTNPITVTPGVSTTYTVTGTTTGCTGTATSVVTVNAVPTVTVNSPTICAGSTATLTAAGGTTYSWSTGATTNPINVSPGSTTTYTVSGTTSGCTGTTTSVVTVNANPTVTVNSPSICAGSTATLTAAGGTTYNWSTGASTNPITVTPGANTTYTVTGTTSGCTGTTTSVVTVNAIPTVTVNSPTICAGTTATLTAAGATTYNWSTGASTNPITVTPGVNTTYTVTGTTTGCTGTTTSVVTVTPLPTVTVNSPTICAGATATLTAAGATSYSWSGGLGAGNPKTVTPGANITYTVSGTTSGCTGTAQSVVTVTPLPTVTVNSPTICAGATATLTAAGATTYNWSTGASTNPITVTPGANTTYTVSGTASGCTGTNTSVVTVNPLPTVTVNSPSICAGGTATLTAAGATTYSWSGGLGTGNPVTTSPGATVTYTVTGTSLGCTGTAQSIVTVGASLSVSVNSPIICLGQTATLTASGATTYSWTGGLGTGNPVTTNPAVTTTYTVTGTTAGCSGTAQSVVTVNTTLTVTVNNPSICSGTTATLTAAGATSYSWSGGLGAGNPVTTSPGATTTYTVTGTTAGCTGTTQSVVTVTPSPTVTVNNPSICSGSTATLTAAGATTYSWSGGLGTGNPVTTSPGSTVTYTVTGTASGCTGTAQSVVTVNAYPTVSVNSPTICVGSSATLTANGGTTYNWSGGLGTGNPVTTSPASTVTYTVSGTTSGCTSTAQSIVTVNANPTVTVNSPAICAGLTATLTAAGATSYSWSGGLGTGNPVTTSPSSTTTYTVSGTTGGCTGTTTSVVTVNAIPIVTVNSPSICSGATATLTAGGATTYSWSGGLGTGNPVTTSPASTITYTVSGTTSGCTGTTASVVTVNAIPTITVNSPTICAGDIATLTAGGATTYNWSGGLGTGNPVTTTPGTTTTYTVSGTVSGCTGINQSVVTVNPTPTVTVNSPSICSGETATLTAGGATSYNWSGGLGTGNPVNATPAGTITYTVSGTASGCTGTTQSVVTVNPIPTITVNSPTICSGSTATLTANGGSSYNWSGGLGTSNPLTVSPSGTTTYTVTGTDLGCSSTAEAVVAVNPNPSVIVNSETICSGATATLTASGAVSYDWSSGLGTLNPVTVTPVTTTTYTVTGTSLGCSGTAESVVTVNLSPTVTVNNATICAGETATLTAGGAASYDWDNGLGSGNPVTVSPLVNTTYTVTGTDIGCIGTAQSIVTVNPIPIITVSGDSICEGQAATLTALGADTYLWSDGLGTSNVATTPVLNVNTTYTVTGTSLGCDGSTSVEVTVSAIPPTPVIIDIGGGVLSSNAVSGNQWYLDGTPIAGETNQTYTPTTTGNYTVIVTLNGCSSAASNIIFIVGMDERGSAGIMVYPNPTFGRLTIDLGLNTSDADIQIFNLLGESLIKVNNNGQQKTTIDLNALPNGVYCIRIFYAGKIYNTRVVKQD